MPPSHKYQHSIYGLLLRNCYSLFARYKRAALDISAELQPCLPSTVWIQYRRIRLSSRSPISP